jgi:hypothetical protein
VSTLSAAAVVIDRAAYLERRAADRARMIPLRRERRVRLGDQVVVEFENAETLGYQVQEMVFTEGITDRAEVEHEVWAYGRMLPTTHELYATLFIELDDVRTVKDELARLTGIQHAIRLDVAGEQVAGVELPGPDEEGPSAVTMSVHFLRFAFPDAQRAAFCDPDVPCLLVVEHPEYNDSVPVEGALRRRLIADLTCA